MGKIILYLVPIVFSVLVLSSVWSVVSNKENTYPVLSKVFAAMVFISGLLIYWWALITVVGPVI